MTVIEAVYDAVGMAERLSRLIGVPGDLVFGRFNFEPRYPWFRDWANGPAGQRLGLAEIPGGAVNPRMLRRTLARELAYRPGGLLAAKIALKHVSVVTTEGYANSRELHQPGEKPQVSSSQDRRNSVPSVLMPAL